MVRSLPAGTGGTSVRDREDITGILVEGRLLHWASMLGGSPQKGPRAAAAGALARTARRIRQHPRIVTPVAAALVALLVLLVNGLSPAQPPARRAGRVVDAACGVDQVSLARMARDYFPSRTGDLQLVPTPPDFVAGPHGEITHEGIEPNLQHVPLLVFGPGYIRRGPFVYRPVTTAAIAPTFARLLGFAPRTWFPDEAPLAEALKTPPDSPRPPKLVVTVVWEGVGRDVLTKWPHSWPYLRQLRRRGAWRISGKCSTARSATGFAARRRRS